MKRVGCLFLPYFLASVTVKENPRLYRQPVAVFREGRVIGISREIEDHSLTGLPLNQARRHCPEAFFVEYDHSVHRAAQEDYLQMLAGISPLIEPLDEQECFLDLNGGRIELEMEKLGRWFEAREWGPVLMGVGANKLLARLATRVPYGKNQTDVPGFCCRVVEPGQEKDFLARIPLALDWLLPSSVVEKLGFLGFTRFGELDSLSLQELLKILGPDGYTVYQHRRGRDNTPLLGLYPPEKLSCHFGFDRGVYELGPLEKRLGEGARLIASALRERGMNCRQVALQVELEGGNCRAERRVSRGAGEERRLREILGILLKNLSLTGPILGMTLEVSSLYRWSLTEQDLFTLDKRSTRPHQELKGTVEALEGKIPGAVHVGVAIDRREQVLSLWDPWRFGEASR
ncbi:MAG: hypothetical protein GXY92_01455 [Syntrophomonadaceae bacterium]|nr:hypothetical protein [Syntrophomonadaceae bacterium]